MIAPHAALQTSARLRRRPAHSTLLVAPKHTPLPPPGAGGDAGEASRALRAAEGPCWTCNLCSDGGGCPSETGVWYSDSYTVNAKGCGFDAAKGYMAPRVGIRCAAAVGLVFAASGRTRCRHRCKRRSSGRPKPCHSSHGLIPLLPQPACPASTPTRARCSQSSRRATTRGASTPSTRLPSRQRRCAA